MPDDEMPVDEVLITQVRTAEERIPALTAVTRRLGLDLEHTDVVLTPGPTGELRVAVIGHFAIGENAWSERVQAMGQS